MNNKRIKHIHEISLNDIADTSQEILNFIQQRHFPPPLSILSMQLLVYYFESEFNVPQIEIDENNRLLKHFIKEFKEGSKNE